jgi:hypothetical protein
MFKVLQKFMNINSIKCFLRVAPWSSKEPASGPYPETAECYNTLYHELYRCYIFWSYKTKFDILVSAVMYITGWRTWYPISNQSHNFKHTVLLATFTEIILLATL